MNMLATMPNFFFAILAPSQVLQLQWYGNSGVQSTMYGNKREAQAGKAQTKFRPSTASKKKY